MNAYTRRYRRQLPRSLSDAAADVRRRFGMQKFTARDVKAIVERFANTCQATGARGGLVLVLKDETRPFSADNAVPVRRSVAGRMNFRLPTAQRVF